MKIIAITLAGAFAALSTMSAAQAAPLAPASIGVVSELRPEPVFYRRGFYFTDGVYYFNGYRGYVYARPGYRYYRGYWYPGVAFATGVVVGSAVHALPPAPPVASAHIRWCYDRYATYRAWDDTYQPYAGPRQVCLSPYD
jgi:hypothetical protein